MGCANLLNRRKTSLRHPRKSSTPTSLQTNASSSEHSLATHGLDIDSLRKKLQRTTIEDLGVRKVELWWAALKLQKNARGFFRPIEPQLSKKANGISSCLPGPDENMSISRSPLHYPEQPISNEAALSSLFTQQTLTSAALPNMYNILWRQLSPQLQNMLLKPYRDTENPKGFPYGICVRILVTASNANNILSSRQIEAIIKHARTKSTLSREMDALAKGNTHQKLKMLEAMGCLTYPMRMAFGVEL
jgi:hypothetical protein